MSFPSYLSIVLAMGVLCLALLATQDDNWKTEAIIRGYAAYCPADGHFAWKGECDK